MHGIPATFLYDALHCIPVSFLVTVVVSLHCMLVMFCILVMFSMDNLSAEQSHMSGSDDGYNKTWQ